MSASVGTWRPYRLAFFFEYGLSDDAAGKRRVGGACLVRRIGKEGPEREKLTTFKDPNL